MVSGMTEPPMTYDVIVTVAVDGGCGPDPSGFAVAARQAAVSRNASVMSAHTWDKIISVVTVQTPDRSSAASVALAVVSEALSARPRHPAADRPMAQVMRRLVEHGVPVVLVAAPAAPQGHVPHAQGHARLVPAPGRRCTASTRFSAAYRRQANARTGSAQACGQTMKQASKDHALSCHFQSQDGTRVSADRPFHPRHARLR
jgi:hypothetical protein